MKRTYELALVLHPTLSDEEQYEVVEEYRKMITSGDAEIVKEESWGKRKLAFPINKLKEGRYQFLYITTDGAPPPFGEVELRLNQNEKVLRYITIRTDEDLQRSIRRGKKAVPAAEAVGLVESTTHQPAPVAAQEV